MLCTLLCLVCSLADGGPGRDAILDYHSTVLKAQGACHIAVGDVVDVFESEIAVRLKWNHLGDLPPKEVRISTTGRQAGQAYEAVERGERVFCFAFCRDVPSDLRFELRYRSPRRMLLVRHTMERVGEVGKVLRMRHRTEMLRNLHCGGREVLITIPAGIASVTDEQMEFVKAVTRLQGNSTYSQIEKLLGKPESRHQDRWTYYIVEDSIEGGFYIGANVEFEAGRLKEIRLSSGHISLEPAFER